MPYDPSGNFSRVHNWKEDRDNGIRILADRHDEEDDNFSNAFNVAFMRNGIVPMTGSLNMGSNGINAIKAGTEPLPSLTWELSNATGIYQVNNTALGFSANGVKKLEVNPTGVNITGNLAVSGSLTVPGSIATGPLTVNGIVAAKASAADGVAFDAVDSAGDPHKIVYRFVNNEYTVAYGYVGYSNSVTLTLYNSLGDINIQPTGTLTLTGVVSVTSNLSVAGVLTVSGGGASSFAGGVTVPYLHSTGALDVDGGLRAGSLTIDPQYYLSISGGNPILAFDSNDYMYYNRANNTLNMTIAGGNAFYADSGLSFHVGGTNLWVSADRLLMQHDGTTGFIRTQTGRLWLGANGSNNVFIETDGQLVNQSNSIKANGTIQSGLGGGSGYSLINPGDSTHTGYLRWLMPDGSSLGYLGYGSNADNVINYTNEKGGNHWFHGGFILNDSEYRGGAVRPFAGTGDGIAVDCRDVSGNTHNNNIRFVDNGISTEYGRLGYQGDTTLHLTNGLGDLTIQAATWINSIANIRFYNDMFQPNCPLSAAGGNAIYASGNNNQRLRSTSARRYKTNINDIGDEVSILSRLRPVRYNSLCEADDPDRVFYGLIAEEVEELDANFVEYGANKRPEGLNYQAFIPLLIKEVQALRAEVEYLKGYGRST